MPKSIEAQTNGRHQPTVTAHWQQHVHPQCISSSIIQVRAQNSSAWSKAWWVCEDFCSFETKKSMKLKDTTVLRFWIAGDNAQITYRLPFVYLFFQDNGWCCLEDASSSTSNSPEVVVYPVKYFSSTVNVQYHIHDSDVPMIQRSHSEFSDKAFKVYDFS